MTLRTSIPAQTPQAQKAEADRLFNEGVNQYKKEQFQQSRKSFQKALTIYQEISDRIGERDTLAKLKEIDEQTSSNTELGSREAVTQVSNPPTVKDPKYKTIKIRMKDEKGVVYFIIHNS